MLMLGVNMTEKRGILLFSLITGLPSAHPHGLVRDLLYASFTLRGITSYVFLADQIKTQEIKQFAVHYESCRQNPSI